MSIKAISVALIVLGVMVGRPASLSFAADANPYADVLNGPGSFEELAGTNGQMKDAGCGRIREVVEGAHDSCTRDHHHDYWAGDCTAIALPQ
jgi:hypothetical protein